MVSAIIDFIKYRYIDNTFKHIIVFQINILTNRQIIPMFW